MRLTLIAAIAILLTPVALTARPAGAPGLTATQAAQTEISAAAKKGKKKATKKKTEENMKAAPSAPPATKY